MHSCWGHDTPRPGHTLVPQCTQAVHQSKLRVMHPLLRMLVVRRATAHEDLACVFHSRGRSCRHYPQHRTIMVQRPTRSAPEVQSAVSALKVHPAVHLASASKSSIPTSHAQPPSFPATPHANPALSCLLDAHLTPCPQQDIAPQCTTSPHTPCAQPLPAASQTLLACPPAPAR